MRIDLERVVVLFLEGLSLNEIGRQLAVESNREITFQSSSIYRVLHRAGIHLGREA